jgi:hypothetical protein
VVRIVGRLIRRLMAVQSAAVLRAVRANMWQGGRRVRRCGWPRRWVFAQRAHRLLKTAARLEDLPATKEAFARGDLSPDEAEEVAAGAEAHPAARDPADRTRHPRTMTWPRPASAPSGCAAREVAR